MSFESILIVTYGRSGSTLLQGVLNSLPGYLIRGENYNFVYSLFGAYSAVKKARREFGGDGSHMVENPWYGADALSGESMLADISALVRKQLLGELVVQNPVCVGFKEIRYLPEGLGVGLGDYNARFREYIQFLSLIFPKLGVIYLTRDHDQVCRSAWWKNRNSVQVKRLLSAFEAVVEEVGDEFCPTFTIDYSELIENGSRVGELFEFLGLQHDKELVRQVLNREHSFKTVGGKEASRAVNPVPSDGEPRLGVKVEPELPGMIKLFAPDKPEMKNADPGVFQWGGILVLDIPFAGWRLQYHQGKEVAPVQWGIPSPWAANQLPELGQAKEARYKGPAIVLKRGEPCELKLISPEGDQVILASVFRY